MIRDKVASCYKIPLTVLAMYESWDFVAAEHGLNEFRYNQTDLERLAFIQLMQKMDFDETWICEHVQHKTEGSLSKQNCCQIFRKKRREFLDEIHALEDKVCCLDNLCYEMKHNVETENHASRKT